MPNLVFGEGAYSSGEYKSRVRGKQTKEYTTWVSMLVRCYSPSWLLKHPSYRGSSVSENFKNFQFFAEWCNSQIGFGNKGWQLDKDILGNGRKFYSENTCVFVPRSLNNLVLRSRSDRGLYPVGVCLAKRNGKFQAQVCRTGLPRDLGYYDTADQAFIAYKAAKEEYIKNQAIFWKDQIDIRVYEALITWELCIND